MNGDAASTAKGWARAIDTVGFFVALADEMNEHPERCQVIGDAEMDAVIVMRAPDSEFRVRLRFNGLRCEDIAVVRADELQHADFRLVGDASAWHVMFGDVVEHQRATGLQTINSLALMGDAIMLEGDDPMGIDKFSRFNQTLQEFFDGAAVVLAPSCSV